MRANYVVLLVLVSGLVEAGPKSPGAELVYGGGVSFALHAPSGWVLDTKSGRDQGMDAVYYAKGSSFGEARVVGFARAMAKNKQTVVQVMDQAVAAMREHAPKLTVDPTSAFTCGNNIGGRLLTVAHDPVGNAEALVFLEEGDAVIMIGLLASDDARRTASMPKLRELCDSYKFVGPVTH